MIMQFITTFPSPQGIGGSLLKLTAVLAFAVGLCAFLKALDPRWRVHLLRTILVLIPLLIMAHSWAPAWRVSTDSIPQAVQPLFQSAAPVELAQPIRQIDPVASPPALPVEETNWVTVFFAVWAGGALLLLVREAIGWLNASGQVHRAVPASPRLESAWREISGDFGLGEIDVRVMDEEQSPFILPALGRSLVAVPKSFESGDSAVGERITHALRHEAAHLRAGDHFWMPLMRVGACLLWFHPLMWCLAAGHLRACEEACDAEAARRGGVDGYRKALAKLALDLMPARQAGTVAFLRLPTVRHRIDRLAKTAALEPPHFWAIAPAMTALLMCIGGLGVLQVKAQAEPGADREEVTAMTAKLDSIIIPKVSFEQMEVGTVVQFLQLVSKKHDPEETGVPIDLMDVNNQAKITLTTEGASLHKILRRVSEMAGLSLDVGKDGVVLRKRNAAKTVDGTGDAPTAMTEKLDSIIIPKVSFKEMEVGTVVQFLQLVSKKHDPEETGVPIDLMDVNNQAKITLTTEGASLHKILRRVSEMAGLSLDVEKDGVVLRKPGK